MDVRDAVASRFSCRAFLPTPVPLAVVRDILERAARSPSGGNLQPWRVDALAGAPLEALKALIRPRHAELPRGEGAEYQIYPAPLKEPYHARRFEVGALLYAALGIPREDRPARLTQYARNFEMFGAPVGLFVSIDRAMGPPQWSDLGGFVQTILLLARAHGLHSCPRRPGPTGTRPSRRFSVCRPTTCCSAASESASPTRRRPSTAGAPRGPASTHSPPFAASPNRLCRSPDPMEPYSCQQPGGQ